MKQILETGKRLFQPFQLMIIGVILLAMAIDSVLGSAVSGYSLAMAVLAADRDTNEKAGVFRTYGVKAATEIFAGSMVCVDADGYAVPAADTAGLIFVGRAESQIDNSAGASGALSVTVKRGTFNWAATSLTIANIGDPVFVLDDQTVGIASGSTNKIFAGVISEIESATSAWVEQDFTLHQPASGVTVAAVATANGDATYGQPEADLLNELKAQVNALLTSLKNAGVIRT